MPEEYRRREYLVYLPPGRIGRISRESLEYKIEGLRTILTLDTPSIICIGKNRISMICYDTTITKQDIEAEIDWAGEDLEILFIKPTNSLMSTPNGLPWGTKIIEIDSDELTVCFNRNPKNKIHPNVRIVSQQQNDEVRTLTLNHPQECIFQVTRFIKTQTNIPAKAPTPKTKLIFNVKYWLPITPNELDTDFMAIIQQRYNYKANASFTDITQQIYLVISTLGDNKKNERYKSEILSACKLLASYIETCHSLHRHPGTYLTLDEANSIYLKNLSDFLMQNGSLCKTDFDRKFKNTMLAKLISLHFSFNEIEAIIKQHIDKLSPQYNVRLLAFLNDIGSHHVKRLLWIEQQYELERILEHAMILDSEADYYSLNSTYAGKKATISVAEDDRLEYAIVNLKVALNDCMRATTADKPQLLKIYEKLGYFYQRKKDFTNALFYLKEAHVLRTTYHKHKKSELATNCFSQGLCYLNLSDSETARPLLEQALKLYQQYDPSNVKEIQDVKTALSICNRQFRLSAPAQQSNDAHIPFRSVNRPRP